MAHRLKNFLLFCYLIIISVSLISAQDCTFTAGTNSMVNGATVSCSVSEQAPGETAVCDFYANGQAEIVLTDYSSPDITQFMTLTTEPGIEQTKATLILQNTVDDVADTVTYIMGSLVCTPTASLLQDRWRSLTKVESTPAYLTVTFNTINDFTPEFPQSTFVVDNLPETFPDNIDVLSTNGVSINATDGDTPNIGDSKIGFTLQDDFDGSFSVQTNIVQSDTGVTVYTMGLYVLKVLDYDKYKSYTLTVIATDQGSTPLSSTATLTLSVDDKDNLDPKFQSMFYYTDVPELSVGEQLLTMQPAQIFAEDQDSGLLTPVLYALVFNNDGSECSEECQAMTNAFSIDPASGVITMDTNEPGLDTITSRVASFAVTATQVDDARHSANAFVSVSLPPSSTTPTTTGTSVNPCTTFSPTACPTPPPCPTVEPTTILVTTECPTPPPCPTTDASTTTECPTPAPCPTTDSTIVTDPTTCPPPSPCPTVDTTIVTEPTTCPPPTPCPTWDTSTVTTSTNCPTPPPCPTATTVVTEPSDHTGSTTDCVCPTSGSDATVTECPTTAPTHPTTFIPSEVTGGKVSTQYTCYPSDPTNAPSTGPSGTPPPTTAPGPTTTTLPKSTYAPAPANNLIITVKNVSVFTEVGTILVQMHEVEGRDGDFLYSLESNTGDASQYFDIDSFTGDVFVKALLHYSSNPYSLIVFADGPNGRDNASLNIEVVNSAGKPVFDVVAQEYSITEGEDNGLICSLNSYYEDNQYNRQYWIYKVVPDSDVFEVNPYSGDLTFTGPLDYETSHTYDVTITVTTSGARSSRNLDLNDDPISLEYNQALVHINVVDVNDNAPTFDVYGMDGDSVAVGISSYTTSGQDVVQLSATDADTENDNKQVVYEMNHEHFYINKDTGVIRASTSLDNLEFALTDHSSYTFTVTAHNIADEDVSNSLDVEVYILSEEQILMLNTTYTPEEFDTNCKDILTTLTDAVGADVRVLKYEDDKSAADPFTRSRRNIAVGSDDVVTTVYLYALDSSGPLENDELLNLIANDGDAFSDAGFIVSSAVIYSEVGPFSPADDNTTYIIIISCLAAVAGVALIAVAITMWKYMQERKKLKGIGKSNERANSSHYSESGDKKVGNGTHAVQALSPGWTRTSVQWNQEDQMRTDLDSAELVPESNVKDVRDEPLVYERVPEVDRLDTISPIEAEIASSFEGASDFDGVSGIGLDDEEDIVEHQEPDPDYLQSILVDPKTPKIDDDSKSTKSSPGVTFSDTTEVISVVELDDDDIDDEPVSAQL